MAVNEEGARRLELLRPLLYIKADPFREPQKLWDQELQRPQELREREEWLFCFNLDKALGRSIEPDPAVFLGPLRASGYRDSGPFGSALPPEGPETADRTPRSETLELPKGRYLFAQKREALGRDAVINLAIEVQKDGLWERLQPEEHLYVRYLYEDGAAVTQIFRPYRENLQEC
ncbi:MAG: hypothetical protein LBI94_00295 [Treponema sp.]|nr:hypothetical protein [Treponema sp.]